MLVVKGQVFWLLLMFFLLCSRARGFRLGLPSVRPVLFFVFSPNPLGLLLFVQVLNWLNARSGAWRESEGVPRGLYGHGECVVDRVLTAANKREGSSSASMPSAHQTTKLEQIAP